MDALVPLALLACPIGMGLMMFFMMRGMGGSQKKEAPGASLPDLKAEQARLAEKIAALEQPPAAEAVEPEGTAGKPAPADVR